MAKENDLDIRHCVEVLQWLDREFVSNNGSAAIGFSKFILGLEKYNDTLSERSIVRDRDNFIRDFQILRQKYIEMTDREFLDFIKQNFDFLDNELSRSSLETFFYQKIK
ncbi:hypothetical protein [Winogradskyella sp. A2]|uniref:hypothetical protein n=1 Tax=Winogradskyella sp. A2 TaxID=3366944 RepID=UPI00398C7371